MSSTLKIDTSTRKGSVPGLRTPTVSKAKLTFNPRELTPCIQDYELLSDIGGVDDLSYLYLARFKGEHLVALKYTDLTLSPDFEFIQDLVCTVQNTNLCAHPHILPYFLTFVENERLWTVTLPMRGGSCRHLMKTHYPRGFSETAVATLLKPVLTAVAYLHANHLIHNDIRANNILLDRQGDVRLTGMRSLVSLSQGGEYVKSVFQLMGDNIEWAAPEVMAQNANYNQKADIYSFGITVLELYYNKTPFDDWAPLKVLLCKLRYDCPAIDQTYDADPQGAAGTPAPPQAHDTAETRRARLADVRIMSPHLQNLVQACLQKDPAARPSAAELLHHPFFKQARGREYLEQKLLHVLGPAGEASPGAGDKTAAVPASASASARSPSAASAGAPLTAVYGGGAAAAGKLAPNAPSPSPGTAGTGDDTPRTAVPQRAAGDGDVYADDAAPTSHWNTSEPEHV